MANEEELFPIDIHYNKLLDWLIDRRHCDNKWHSLAKLLRQRVSTAIQNLPPSNERLKELTQSSNFNYFHALQVLEQLKSSEGEGKSLFGHYTSPLVKEWAEISRSYEKDNLYLAECAQQLTRSVNYEVPSLKQQLAKCQQTQRDCLRKEGELSASAAALREKFEASCKEMEIKGASVREELTRLVQELPSVYQRVLGELPSCLPAFSYYEAFLHYSTGRHSEGLLPMMSFVLKQGNVTVYQWTHDTPPPQDVESETLAVSESINGSGPDAVAIDWGDSVQGGGIDFGESEPDIDYDIGAVDLSVITVEECGDGEGGEEVNLASKKVQATSTEHQLLLENTTTRNLFLDDIMELREFLRQRYHELTTETSGILQASQFGSDSEQLRSHSHETVSEMLDHVTRVLDHMTNSRTQHLFLMKGSQHYLDRLADSLLQTLRLSNRALAQAADLVSRRDDAMATARELEPRLTSAVAETKSLEKQIAADISRRYSNRVVNIMGEIRQL